MPVRRECLDPRSSAAFRRRQIIAKPALDIKTPTQRRR
ncbi:hypothetical protein PALB_2750 [Pseudoalteromonas luteoviolacea B = ATCC 29581]|nr:hypothetical protein PALB_2750 [Pseudoalteromonas luteoviolacea B = ATCC 29581]